VIDVEAVGIFQVERAGPNLLGAFARLIHDPGLKVRRMGRIARTGVEGRLVALGENSVLEIDEITGTGSIQCIPLKQVPVNDVAVTVVIPGAVDPRPDFPRSRASESQVVGEVIQVLVVDRLGDGWSQHAQRSACPAENSAAVAPSGDGLKSLRRIDQGVGAVRFRTSSQQHQGEKQYGWQDRCFHRCRARKARVH
jgi:hypothetical protein